MSLARSRAALLVAALGSRAVAQDAPVPPDARETRQTALALIRALRDEVIVSPSATQVLQKWCRDRRLAEEPEIVAYRVDGADKPPTAKQRQRLQIGGTEPVKYRRVELRCGDHILSIADNWYVPGRLDPEMNRLLETTRTPFGTAVRGLQPYRRTIASRLLWTGDAAASAISDALFEHRAVLYTRDHVPFSEVHEVYQRALLGTAKR